MCNGIYKKIEDMKKKYTEPVEAELSETKAELSETKAKLSEKDAKLSEVQRNIVEIMLEANHEISKIAEKSGISEEEVIKIKEELNK